PVRGTTSRATWTRPPRIETFLSTTDPLRATAETTLRPDPSAGYAYDDLPGRESRVPSEPKTSAYAEPYAGAARSRLTKSAAVPAEQRLISRQDSPLANRPHRSSRR